MKFSPRALDFLHYARRRRTVRTPAGIRRLLRAGGVPASALFVATQSELGGIEYGVGDDSFDMRIDLFRPPSVSPRTRSGIIPLGELAVECMRFAAGPQSIYLGESGTLYAVTSTFAAARPIASSITPHIESDALMDEIYREDPPWYCVIFAEISSDDQAMDQRLDGAGIPRIAEACDEHTRWWGDRNVRLERNPLVGDVSRRDSVRGFAGKPDDLDALVALLDGVAIARTPPLRLPAW